LIFVPLSLEGGRVGRHPMRIYSHWTMGKGIIEGMESVVAFSLSL